MRERTPQATARAAAARAALERFPMPAALKTVCARAGFPSAATCAHRCERSTPRERCELEGVVRGLLEVVPA